MKNQTLQFRGMLLIKVEKTNTIFFNSAIEKTQFCGERKQGTYTLAANRAEEYLYMVIDPTNDGCCLTPKHAIPYYEAITLINMYLKIKQRHGAQAPA